MNSSLSTSNNRIEWVDVAKGFGIILVIIGHMVDGQGPIGQLIWSFHMPLFFYLSGYFFKPLFTLEAIYGKIRQLIYPCIIFSTAIFVVEYYIVGNDAIIPSLENGLPHTMWFLTTLFLSMIWSSFLLYFCTPVIGACISLLVAYVINFFAILQFYSIGSTFIAAFFLLAGKKRCIIRMGGAKLIVAVVIWGFLIYTNNIHTSLSNNQFSLVGIIVAFMGIMIVVSMSNTFVEVLHESISTSLMQYVLKLSRKILLFMGHNTLVLMSVHMLLLSLFICYVHIHNAIVYKIIQILFVFSMSILWAICLKKPIAYIQGRI